MLKKIIIASIFIVLQSCYVGRPLIIDYSQLENEDYVSRYFKIQKDEFSDAVFYQPKFNSLTSNRVELEIATTINNKGIRVPLMFLKINYSDSRWIFFENIKLKLDSKVYTFKAENKQETSGTSVFESSTISELKFPAGFTKDLQNAENAKLQLIGQSIEERKLEKNELAALKNSIKYFNYLKNQANLN